ncbi:MAG TPA: crossover junction endodeoxyribonuclease RuvC [Bacillota bacterium]
MIVLGIDPGTSLMGFGVVEEENQKVKALEYGCLRTSAGRPRGERLSSLYDEINGLIDRHRPDRLAIEELFFNRNVTTALSVGEARGIVLLAAHRAGLPVEEYNPMLVKQAVVGYGRADKQQVQNMVRVILGLSEIPRPDDAADALAIAICALHSGLAAAVRGGPVSGAGQRREGR